MLVILSLGNAVVCNSIHLPILKFSDRKTKEKKRWKRWRLLCKQSKWKATSKLFHESLGFVKKQSKVLAMPHTKPQNFCNCNLHQCWTFSGLQLASFRSRDRRNDKARSCFYDGIRRALLLRPMNEHSIRNSIHKMGNMLQQCISVFCCVETQKYFLIVLLLDIYRFETVSLKEILVHDQTT